MTTAYESACAVCSIRRCRLQKDVGICKCDRVQWHLRAAELLPPAMTGRRQSNHMLAIMLSLSFLPRLEHRLALARRDLVVAHPWWTIVVSDVAKRRSPRSRQSCSNFFFSNLVGLGTPEDGLAIARCLCMIGACRQVWLTLPAHADESMAGSQGLLLHMGSHPSCKE